MAKYAERRGSPKARSLQPSQKGSVPRALEGEPACSLRRTEPSQNAARRGARKQEASQKGAQPQPEALSLEGELRELAQKGSPEPRSPAKGEPEGRSISLKGSPCSEGKLFPARRGAWGPGKESRPVLSPSPPEKGGPRGVKGGPERGRRGPSQKGGPASCLEGVLGPEGSRKGKGSGKGGVLSLKVLSPEMNGGPKGGPELPGNWGPGPTPKGGPEFESKGGPSRMEEGGS
ncbi:hypothetical protein H6P81_011084 [Aristolochia fimbriata]|uniref:Uncharacterized protein n=1 Tax=Aristolochia fimbriata TaxID=158543 RepID=A0AAV7ERS4_ARIFI|nr:hypothetical protein H6P81_011084 [Aristolochia fimbriata]